jgi:hypothetical protein
VLRGARSGLARAARGAARGASSGCPALRGGEESLGGVTQALAGRSGRLGDGGSVLDVERFLLQVVFVVDLLVGQAVKGSYSIYRIAQAG